MIATLETAQRIEYTERRLFTISPLPRFRQYSPMSLILYSATLSPTLPPHLYKTTRCIFLFFLSLSLSLSLSLALYSLRFILYSPFGLFCSFWCAIHPASHLPSFAQWHLVFYWRFLSNIIEFSATDALTASIISIIQVMAKCCKCSTWFKFGNG